MTVNHGSDHTFEQSVYHHPEVRRALERLFHCKCVYCESSATSTRSWDVKTPVPSRTGTDSRTRGRNLYLSCPRCNQSRMDPPTWDEPEAGPASKLDQFPLAGAYRAFKTERLRGGRRLLLDPCVCRTDPNAT